MTARDDLLERLEARARASFEANKSFGRKGKEWALETEVEFQAARRIKALEKLAVRLIEWIEDEVGAELPFADGDEDLALIAASIKGKTNEQ